MPDTLPNSIAAPLPWDLMQKINSIPAPELSMSPATSLIPMQDAPVAPNMVSPAVAYAPPTQMQRDQTELDRRINTGSGVSQIHNPFLHGLAAVGDTALAIAAPRIAALTPGTQMHHDRLVGQQQALVANDQQQAANEANVANVQAQTDERNALGDKASALALSDTPAPLSAEDATAIGHPELAGLSMSPRDRQKYFTGIGKQDTSSSNNENNNDTRLQISQDKLEAAAKAAAAKPENRDDHYINILTKPPAERTPDDIAYKQAYEGYINTKMTQPRVAGAMARPVQVVLPGSDHAVYQTAGNAIRTGATSLGDNTYRAQGAALKDFTSGADSHTLTAFNTADHHLNALSQAADALNNGDIQGINKIANAYGVATGQSAPVVFQGVKTAVSGEIAKAFTGAGATVDEIGEIRKSINDAESPQQLHDVVNGYRGLLHQKAGVLQDQFNSAQSGRPNFTNTAPVAPSGADNEVYVGGKLVGHTVGGKYVPLK